MMCDETVTDEDEDNVSDVVGDNGDIPSDVVGPHGTRGTVTEPGCVTIATQI